ncbi:MAG: 50S ribosomal protein L23 [Fuerstiella sp.]|jgi:large subunit ribosomal protein L23
MSETKTGVQLESHMVIRRPLVTEKGVHASERLNAYAFEIHPLATKSDVKVAVEELWGVRVAAVRTQSRKGKPRRQGATMGHSKGWKKAVVKLHDEDRISFF